MAEGRAHFEMAAAKVSLALDVVGRRADGYHLLRMLAQSVTLYDELMVTPLTPVPPQLTRRGRASGSAAVEIECNDPGVPTDARNSVCKAALVMAEATGLDVRCKVHLTKRIPVSSGLGGESSDAAATLRALNAIYGLGLSATDLRTLGVRVGADVPFCVTGGCALVEGIGDIVSPLPSPQADLAFLLVRPPGDISTPEVYKRFAALRAADPALAYPRPEIEPLIAWLAGPSASASASASAPPSAALAAASASAPALANSLELVTAAAVPAVDATKERLVSLGATRAVMTGHGPTVVGLFARRDPALQVASGVCSAFPGCWVAWCEAAPAAPESPREEARR